MARRKSFKEEVTNGLRFTFMEEEVRKYQWKKKVGLHVITTMDGVVFTGDTLEDAVDKAIAFDEAFRERN